MNSMMDYLKRKHDTKECIHRYHRHKEWIFFVSLFSTILFLVVWSGWVNFKLTELEKSLDFHERFDKGMLESHIIIVQELKLGNPEMQKEAIRKLDELNEEMKRHADYDYRK